MRLFLTLLFAAGLSCPVGDQTCSLQVWQVLHCTGVSPSVPCGSREWAEWSKSLGLRWAWASSSQRKPLGVTKYSETTSDIQYVLSSRPFPPCHVLFMLSMKKQSSQKWRILAADYLCFKPTPAVTPSIWLIPVSHVQPDFKAFCLTLPLCSIRAGPQRIWKFGAVQKSSCTDYLCET